MKMKNCKKWLAKTSLLREISPKQSYLDDNDSLEWFYEWFSFKILLSHQKDCKQKTFSHSTFLLNFVSMESLHIRAFEKSLLTIGEITTKSRYKSTCFHAF